MTDQDLDVEHDIFPSRAPSKPVYLSNQLSKRTTKKNSSHSVAKDVYLRLGSIDRYASKASEMSQRKSKIQIIPNDRAGKEFLIIRTDRDSKQRSLENDQFRTSNR